MDTNLYFWIWIILYMLALVYLTIYGAKRTKTFKDFAIAGGNIGPLVLGFATASTACSAALFMGTPAWAYVAGQTVLWYGIAIFAACTISYMIMFKNFRKIVDQKGSLTLADWFGDRYKSDFIRVFAGLIAFSNIFYVAGQLAGSGFLFNVVANVKYEYGVILGALIVIIYIAIGGSRTDVYTDFFQALLMAAIAVLIAISVFWMFKGGYSEVLEKLRAQDPNLLNLVNPKNPVFARPIDIFSIFLFYFTFGMSPQLMNKMMMLNEPEKNGRKFILVYGIALFIFCLMIFGGLYARAIWPDGTFANANVVIPKYLMLAFPPIIASLCLVALLAAMMSTVDGMFVVFSTVISHDIYRKTLIPRGILSKGDASKMDKKELVISQIATIVVGIICLFFALSPPKNITGFVVFGINAIVAAFAGPLLFGLFSNRPSKYAAGLSMIVGVGVYLIIQISGTVKSVHTAGAYAIIVNLIVMTIATYILKPIPKGQ